MQGNVGFIVVNIYICNDNFPLCVADQLQGDIAGDFEIEEENTPVKSKKAKETKIVPHVMIFETELCVLHHNFHLNQTKKTVNADKMVKKSV